MHDGSVATSEEAIDHYAAGGRTMARTGVGRDNPNKSTTLRGFVQFTRERARQSAGECLEMDCLPRSRMVAGNSWRRLSRAHLGRALRVPHAVQPARIEVREVTGAIRTW